MANRNEKLQALCRDYLHRLRHLAQERGLGGWLNTTIRENKSGECSANESEVMAFHVWICLSYLESHIVKV